ncbi:disulfide bond formation protein B [Alcaligenes faecalis]|nr:disulfide bond formation protein B [Providencia rettgeri]MBX7032361.1 disulfide bond formation protein B [Alcaligenes faecalis]QFY79700.1 disulfide bond formation protein B [Alcaligenes faecalis]
MPSTVQSKSPLAVSSFVNTLGLLGICVALLIAFYYQFVKAELPCPLCLLQRVGLIIVGCGFLCNIRLGVKGTHYGMVLAGSVITGLIAVRQVFLHILPGDVGYGSTLFGLHFYTWTLITSILIVLAVSVMLSMGDREFGVRKMSFFLGLGKAVTVLFIVLIAGNLVSTLLECGFGQCADNPVSYQWLE